jgi:short-subunit dehydrogenase
MAPPPRKLALVTGASGGLGLEFARLLAADGYDVALASRSAGKLEDVARSLRESYGIDAQTLAIDLGVPDAADRVIERFPRCDVLINNAGFANRGRFDGLAESDIDEELTLDVVTLVKLTRKYLPGMVERRDGKILNVASTAGFLPGPFMAVYYAGKAFVISFSQAIGDELRGTGVTVSCLCPGATNTGFADRAKLKDSLLFKRLKPAAALPVAKAGYRGMLAGKGIIVPLPVTNWIVELGVRVTPRRVLLWMSRKAVEAG